MILVNLNIFDQKGCNRGENSLISLMANNDSHYPFTVYESYWRYFYLKPRITACLTVSISISYLGFTNFYVLRKSSNNSDEIPTL